jgi:hypothetical protein
MKRRHRSEYPPDLQDVGDVLGLWDSDGFLVDLSFPLDSESGLALTVTGFLSGLPRRTPAQDSDHGPDCDCAGCARQDFP